MRHRLRPYSLFCTSGLHSHRGVFRSFFFQFGEHDELYRLFLTQVLAVFAGKGEGEDGIGFVNSVAVSGDESQAQSQLVGVILNNSNFYAEGGGQVNRSHTQENEVYGIVECFSAGARYYKDEVARLVRLRAAQGRCKRNQTFSKFSFFI